MFKVCLRFFVKGVPVAQTSTTFFYPVVPQIGSTITIGRSDEWHPPLNYEIEKIPKSLTGTVEKTHLYMFCLKQEAEIVVVDLSIDNFDQEYLSAFDLQGE